MGRILLVDDHAEFLAIQQELLERAGHTVVTASDGNKAISALKKGEIDLVITDIIMPGREGLETIMELQRHEPLIKIIAMSGGGVIGGQSYLELAEKFGAILSLEKPFNEATLLASVNTALNA
jgi:DNA-binding NtrC family response regulator